MIYTVTLNPSIDYVVEVNELTAGEIMRTKAEDLIFGGKGINVSSMLAQLGMKSCALGFIAGFTGDALEQGVAAMGIQPDFLKVEQGFTRINVKVHAQEESEINGQGPQIRYTHLEQLIKKLDRLKKDDILVLSGNVPCSIPQDIYADIMQHLQGSGIRVCVDARQEALMSTLVYHPFLIKPNHKELAEMFEVELSSREDLLVYAKELQAMGARNVLVSMAELYCSLKHRRFIMHRPAGERLLIPSVPVIPWLRAFYTVICVSNPMRRHCVMEQHVAVPVHFPRELPTGKRWKSCWCS